VKARKHWPVLPPPDELKWLRLFSKLGKQALATTKRTGLGER